MEQLEFGLGTPYYYIFLAVSCLIGRALSLAYLRFFRGKRLLIGDTTARSLVIVSFFFIVLSFADDLLVTKLDFDIEKNITEQIVEQPKEEEIFELEQEPIVLKNKDTEDADGN